MSTLLKTLLLVLEDSFHFVFPLSDDERCIRHLTREQVARKLHIQRHGDVVVLSSFQDPKIRAMLHLVKFHHHEKALMLTATLLEEWLNTYCEQTAVLIPLPLSSKRKRTRGYNQVELIARRAVANGSKHHVDTTILAKIRDTKPQTSLKRSERVKNMAGAFSLTAQAPVLHETHVILIDDVMTTGATLRAAKVALQSASPKSITCVAIAH